MIIVVGGSSQGKLQYVLEREKAAGTEEVPSVFDAAVMQPEEIGQYRILNKVHLLIRGMMQEQPERGEPEIRLQNYVNTHPDCILICDEVGSGVVPIDREECEWREKVGRIMCHLTTQADEVDRVICGIAQRIK